MHGEEGYTQLGRPRYGLPKRFRHVVILVVQENPFASLDERADQLFNTRGQLQGQSDLEEIHDSFQIANHVAGFGNARQVQGDNEPVASIHDSHLSSSLYLLWATTLGQMRRRLLIGYDAQLIDSCSFVSLFLTGTYGCHAADQYLQSSCESA